MDEAKELKERLDSLSQANINALSGSGCINIWELRMAYDFMRERLAIQYNDKITTKEILAEVTRRMYAANGIDTEEESDQQVFDFIKG